MAPTLNPQDEGCVQVTLMEARNTYISLYWIQLMQARENPPPKIAGYKVQYLHFWYLKFLVMCVFVAIDLPLQYNWHGTVGTL